MVICPVCEHRQPLATECEVCGKVLSAIRTPDVPVARLPELEVTAFAPASAVQVEAMAELEPTRLESGPDLPAVPLPDLDQSRAPEVTVPIQPLAELEAHRMDPNPAELTPAPTGVVVCRYCQNQQSEGLFCNVCGMRLPRYVPRAQPAGPESLEDAPLLRHACGVLTRAGRRCNSCGVFVPLPAV